ncbi:MAG: YfiR family protein [Alphaproteobacteria bacterium]|nr:YfiR family protein [Alphaproteobacteria bacterium]
MFSPVTGTAAGAPSRPAQEEPLRLQESKIKASLIYNFLKLTRWPENKKNALTDSSLHVCLLGGDAFEGALYPLEGRTAQQRTIYIHELENVSDSGQCQLVFVNKNQEDILPEILNFLKKFKTLTVSDIEGFSRNGGMIEISRNEFHRLRLYMNGNAIEEIGLHVEERLLKLAEVVWLR